MTANGEFPDFLDDFGNEDPADREESLEEENSEESLIVYCIPFYFNLDMKAAMAISTPTRHLGRRSVSHSTMFPDHYPRYKKSRGSVTGSPASI